MVQSANWKPVIKIVASNYMNKNKQSNQQEAHSLILDRSQ